MAISPWKVLLFIIGGLGSAGAGAWYMGDLGSASRSDAPMVAALPGDPAAQVEQAPTAPEPPAVGPSVGEPTSDQAESADTEEVVAPTFDLLRVEPNGSMVIAGRSTPQASIEVVVGSSVIATTTANADRDFVVVLDEPLKPGNYQIVLRSTSPDNVVATSLETALVSVPDSEAGEVLALVEEPGKASRLITVPVGEEIASGSDMTPSAADTEPLVAADTASATVAADATPVSDDAAAAPESEAAPATVTAEAPAPEDVAAAPPQADTTAEAQAPGIAADVTSPTETASADAATAAETARETVAADPTVSEEAAAEAPVVAAEAETQVAMVDPAAPVEPEPEPASAPEPTGAEQPVVRVEAVEIEGRDIFVAGMASPGLLVRVYANAILLGETQASEAGRFLVETERDLPVGDYIVRADLLADGGRKVVARAAVPFQREEGESIAAIAAPSPVVVQTPPTEAPAASVEMAAEPAAPTEQTVAASEPAAQPPAAEPAAPQVAASEPVAQPTAEKPAELIAGEAAASSETETQLVEAQPEAPAAVAETSAAPAAPEVAASEPAAAEPVAEAAAPQVAAEPAAQPNAEKPAEIIYEAEAVGATQDETGAT
ncbi:hypothetical protein EJC49_13175, partial [Aquibium carbonis]